MSAAAALGAFAAHGAQRRCRQLVSGRLPSCASEQIRPLRCSASTRHASTACCADAYREVSADAASVASNCRRDTINDERHAMLRFRCSRVGRVRGRIPWRSLELRASSSPASLGGEQAGAARNHGGAHCLAHPAPRRRQTCTGRPHAVHGVRIEALLPPPPR